MRSSRAGIVVAVFGVILLGSGTLVAKSVAGDDDRPQARVSLPEPAAAQAALRALEAGDVPTAEGLGRVLEPLLAAGPLGNTATAVIADPATGKVLYTRGDAATPASTTKVITALAVLATLGPDARLDTRVVRGASEDEIVLVGGGDPTVTARPAKAGSRRPYPEFARLDALAAATAESLKKSGTTSVRLAFDDSLFADPPVSETWEKDYLTGGVVARITALTVDEARLRPRSVTGSDPRSPDPSAAAARAFAKQLKARGITVSGKPVAAKAPDQATELGKISSPPVSALVEYALSLSDNDLAEALAHHVARKEGKPASFAGAGEAMVQVLGRLGVDTAGVEIFDGSGLSRQNRIPAPVLAKALAVAASPDHPELRAAVTGLPVAGFTGTLEERFAASSAATGRGVIRAKTGTLTGIATLAGVTRDTSGRLLVFVFMSQDATGGPTGPRPALDRLAAAVAACGCR